MSNYSPHTTAIKEDEKLESKSLEVRPDTNMGKYKSEVIKGVTEWSEDDSAAKGQVGDGVNKNQNEQGQKTEGRIWEKMEIGETRGKTPTRGGKGGSPLEAKGGGREEDQSRLGELHKGPSEPQDKIPAKTPAQGGKGGNPFEAEGGGREEEMEEIGEPQARPRVHSRNGENGRANRKEKGIRLTSKPCKKGKNFGKRGSNNRKLGVENQVKVGAWNAAESATQNFEKIVNRVAITIEELKMDILGITCQ